MSSNPSKYHLPDFEIDHSSEYAKYIVEQPHEVRYYLDTLATHKEFITAYINDGEQNFLTTLLHVDAESGTLLFDPPTSSELVGLASQASQITLVAWLERVKILFRTGAMAHGMFANHTALITRIPSLILRLQRREFFRLDLSAGEAVHYRITLGSFTQNSQQTQHLRVLDISAGGLSLEAPMALLDSFKPECLLSNGRLEIPGEPVLSVDLRVQKSVEISTYSGAHKLRIGCTFSHIPAMRLATIERYIARIERERTARNSELAG